MKYPLREAVLKTLDGSEDGQAALTDLRPPEWNRDAFWLDASGLALYFLNALRSQNRMHILPEEVCGRLLQNEADNRRRTESLLAELARVNQALDGAGVQFAVLKGFALFPDYCPDPCRRLQLDLDYLVDHRRMAEISKAVAELGYKVVSELPFEVRFATDPGARRIHQDLYKPPGSHVLEFHFSLFDRPELCVKCPPVLDSTRKVGLFELTLPVLSQADMFLHQIFHAFQDICLFTLRLSCLLEITNCVRSQHANENFWQQVKQRADTCDERVAAMTALVLALAGRTFGCPLPRELAGWIKNHQRKSNTVAVWVERYGNNWALEAFPGNKSSLFIAREFMGSPHRARYTWKNLLPIFSCGSHRQKGLKKNRNNGDSGYRFMRWRFHIREALRVMVEWPRWKWISRGASSG